MARTFGFQSKLVEINELRFFDVCGGPGGFSKMCFAMGPMPVLGYGMTLKIEGNDHSLNWYPDLKQNKNFLILWGSDGTGNVYLPENLAHARDTIKRQHTINLVVADGGFGIRKVNGEHRENYQVASSY